MRTNKGFESGLKSSEIPNSNQGYTEVISVGPFDLPISGLLSSETRKTLQKIEITRKELEEEISQPLPLVDNLRVNDDSNNGRDLTDAEVCYSSPSYRNMRKRYDVSMQPQDIGGVYTEVFIPAEGVSEKNQEYVLINLHGGGFESGSRTISHLESIPIASIGRIKVISIDYRMAPEHQFPAAVNDVVAVYSALLRDYSPENIGIFGASAGGLLASQAIARFLHDDLPLPSAVAMSCGAAHYWAEGDSGRYARSFIDYPIGLDESVYFMSVKRDDPLAFPGKSQGILARFPPSLLNASTRDFALSSVVYTHSQLIRLGVTADLHVWEGLEHTFFYSSDLPESREVYDVIVNFFSKHLGRRERVNEV